MTKEKETFIPSCFGNKQSDYHIPPIFNPLLKIFGSDSHFKANLPRGQSCPAFISKSSLTQPTAGGCRASSSPACPGSVGPAEPKGSAGFAQPAEKTLSRPLGLLQTNRHTGLGT